MVAVTVAEVAYGPDPLQVVTISRKVTAVPGKTVIFYHGGGWTTGGRGSLEAEAAEWAKTGWVAINASYRLGVLDGTPDDGKAILADTYAVLQLVRSLPYVDPTRVVVYGESAGGHLATWVGSKYGPQVAAIIALSPVSSTVGAAELGQAPGAAANVVALGQKAAEFFSYSYGTTDAHRYVDRVQAARVVVGSDPDEWVDPDVHGRAFCAAVGDRCTLTEVPGGLHAGKIIDAHPELAVELRHWADQQL
jgi:acetyl esterase/lipase